MQPRALASLTAFRHRLHQPNLVSSCQLFYSVPLLRMLTPKWLSAHKYRIGIAFVTASIQHSNNAQQEPRKHKLPIKGKGDHDQPVLLVLTSTHAIA
jgi:hypothetical protein